MSREKETSEHDRDGRCDMAILAAAPHCAIESVAFCRVFKICILVYIGNEMLVGKITKLFWQSVLTNQYQVS